MTPHRPHLPANLQPCTPAELLRVLAAEYTRAAGAAYGRCDDEAAAAYRQAGDALLALVDTLPELPATPAARPR